MNNNSLFFKDNMKEVIEEFDVTGIEKFKFPDGHEKAGKTIPWRIKVVSTNKSEELLELCKVEKVSKGRRFKELNQQLYQNSLMAESIAFPDLKDKELLEQYGARTNIELMKILLSSAKDFARIYQEFEKINSADDEKEIEEAKN